MFRKTEKPLRRFQLLDLIERLRAAVSDVVVRGDVAHEETANVDWSPAWRAEGPAARWRSRLQPGRQVLNPSRSLVLLVLGGHGGARVLAGERTRSPVSPCEVGSVGSHGSSRLG